jgi:hypothetical protein
MKKYSRNSAKSVSLISRLKGQIKLEPIQILYKLLRKVNFSQTEIKINYFCATKSTQSLNLSVQITFSLLQ